MSASKTTKFKYFGASWTNVLPKASRSESPLVPISSGPALGSAVVVLPDASIQISPYVLLRNAQLAQRRQQFLIAELYTAVPERRPLHERDAATLDGVCDNHGRFN